MVNSIVVLAVIVLPGWISISAAQLHHPRVVDRTTLMTWGMLFYHAAVVHAIGITAVALITFAWQGYFLGALALDRILIDGAFTFAKEAPGTAFAVFGLYFLWMLIGSVVSGITDLPAKLTYGVSRAARKAKLAPEPVRNELVWHRALDIDRRAREEEKGGEVNIQVAIRMKNGDEYFGDLKAYTILPNSVESKDIRLGNAVLYPNGDESSPVDLNFSDFGGGGVLLNTANISSIHYMFHDDYNRQPSPSNANEDGA